MLEEPTSLRIDDPGVRCTRAWLTTFSFQAPGFYPKLGYETFTVLEDHPAGHRHHFLQKRLAPPRPPRSGG